jgi:hypothetical protein
MTYEFLPEDTELESAPKIDRAALAIRGNIERVESALTEFDKISAGLSDLATRYPVDLVYDVTTGKGMAEAVAHRAAWRDPRINVEKFRKTAKAPVLALGKDIDARAGWLTEQLLAGEEPVDEQIKVEESRKEKVKQDRINAEAGRIIAIQEAIADFGMVAMSASSKPSADIAVALESMRSQKPDALVFQEMLPQAQASHRAAVDKLETVLKAKLHDEAEAAKLAAERAELATLREAAAERRRKDAIAAEAAAKVERDRAAAEQIRLNVEAAACRAQADQEAAEARALAQSAHEAKMKAERDEAAEAKRLADEKVAKELARKRKADVADKKLRDAAATMCAALIAILPMVDDKHAIAIINAAIHEAVGA